MTIGNAEIRSGLYLLKVTKFPEGQPQKAICEKHSLLVATSNNDSVIMLWHYRLDHPSFLYHEKLFPSLFNNKSPKFFQCEICQLSKHVRNSYPTQSYKLSHPFSMIHSDVWGPSRINNITGSRWFVSFVDNHTRITWISHEVKIKSW